MWLTKLPVELSAATIFPSRCHATYVVPATVMLSGRSLVKPTEASVDGDRLT